jgi:hypothetical protein
MELNQKNFEFKPKEIFKVKPQFKFKIKVKPFLTQKFVIWFKDSNLNQLLKTKRFKNKSKQSLELQNKV